MELRITVRIRGLDGRDEDPARVAREIVAAKLVRRGEDTDPLNDLSYHYWDVKVIGVK